MVEQAQELFKSIRRIQIQTDRLAEDLFAGMYHSVFKGQGMEFEEVRDYQVGDDVRSIDWNVTARMNHPYIKSYREEREITVMLIVDVSSSSHFGSKGQLKSELIAEIGAVLAFSAIKNNDKVGLVLFSKDVELYIPPKKGVRHVLRVIRELLVFEPKIHQTDLGKALSFIGRVQRRAGICFLLSDFMCPSCPQEMALIAKRHDLIAICVTDPFERSFPQMDLVEMTDLESGNRQLVDTSDPAVKKHYEDTAKKRIEGIRTLSGSIGAGFIDIRTDESYIEAIRKFFVLRERRRI